MAQDHMNPAFDAALNKFSHDDNHVSAADQHHRGPLLNSNTLNSTCSHGPSVTPWKPKIQEITARYQAALASLNGDKTITSLTPQHVMELLKSVDEARAAGVDCLTQEQVKKLLNPLSDA